jgi:hypothetical protein
MMIRPFVVAAVLGTALVAGAAAAHAPATDVPIALASVVTSAPSVESQTLVSQLLGQWQSDNGQGLLLLQSDGTYGYAIRSSMLSSSEEGRYQVIGTQLTLAPAVRTAEVNGREVHPRLDPLVMAIGRDSSGNLALSLNGSIYHKA